MNNNNFFNLGSLSEKQLDFFQYTKENVNLLIDSTIIDISHLYGCGISFIYNFFSTIGVSGLKDYIYKLGVQEGSQLSIKNTNIESIENTSYGIIYTENNLSTLTNNQLFSLQKEKINKLCELIETAQIVHCIGFGHSALALHDLASTFLYYGINFTGIEDKTTSRQIKSYLMNIKENDLIIIYSFRGKTRLLINIVNFMKKINKKINIWLITSNEKSPLIKLIDEYILIDNNQKRVNQLKNKFIISPLTSQVYFNDFIKNIYFNKYKTKILKNEDLLNEIESWYDYNLIK